MYGLQIHIRKNGYSKEQINVYSLSKGILLLEAVFLKFND